MDTGKTIAKIIEILIVCAIGTYAMIAQFNAIKCGIKAGLKTNEECLRVQSAQLQEYEKILNEK